MQIHTYFAYGLKIRSNLLLPEFIETDGEYDVSIECKYDEPPLIDEDKQGYLRLDHEEVILAIKDLALFTVRKGRQIIIYPAPEADYGTIRAFVVGNIMAALLYQRGMLVLHASSVDVNGSAIAFAGISGAGKSSLAAAFHTGGHKIVADDVTAIQLENGIARVMPGFPQLKLDPEAAQSLGYNTEKLTFLHSWEEKKRGWRIEQRFIEADGSRLRAIYLIMIDDQERIERVQASEAVINLIALTYPTRMVKPGGAQHLFQLAQLVQSVPIFRLLRKPSLSALADHVRSVEEHLQQISSSDNENF